MQISVDNNGNCKRTETKICCITIFPPSIFVEEITYTTERRNMSSQAVTSVTLTRMLLAAENTNKYLHAQDSIYFLTHF